jgi:hypothetical protein
VIIPVPLLSKDRIAQLPKRAREVVEYRKSGLSLNHIQGCSLGCAYCIRHTYGLWDETQPVALMSDAQAVEGKHSGVALIWAFGCVRAWFRGPSG